MQIRHIFLFALGIFLSIPFAYADSSNHYIGVEGFHDRYQEPDVDLTDTTNYGSLIAGYHGMEKGGLFYNIEGRASTGQDHYKSVSGTADGATQYEFEGRLLVGQGMYYDGKFRPYTGLGVRYFRDDGKGLVTNLGFYGYDRRIFQLYIPVGASYEMRTKYFSITPKAEGDILVYGNVSTRLENLGGFNIENRQDGLSGYGLRGEVMLGREMRHYALQFGPFIRYWNIGDSNIIVDGNGDAWIEPQNDRLQLGAAARIIW